MSCQRGPCRQQGIAGSWRLEVTWTLAITIIFFWFNVSGERLWSSMMPPDNMMAAEKRPGEIEIEVQSAVPMVFPYRERTELSVGQMPRSLPNRPEGQSLA